MFQGIDDLLALKTPQSRLMGFDIGDRRVGVSVSDLTWSIASPVGVLDRKTNWQSDFDRMLKSFPLPPPYGAQQKSHSIVGFVIGFPILLNGDIGPQAQKVEQFAKDHLAGYQVPMVLWDERLSTHGANRALMEADMSRAKRQGTIDKMAAVFILQGVLDRLRLFSNH